MEMKQSKDCINQFSGLHFSNPNTVNLGKFPMYIAEFPWL